MPALNFQKQFADAVERGEKCQTIRARRQRPIKKGDTLYLYTGMMHPGCRKLGEVECSAALPITIDGTRAPGGDGWLESEVRIGNRPVDSHFEAKRDGFANEIAMLDWFAQNYGLPFEGVLIRWAKPEPGGDE